MGLYIDPRYRSFNMLAIDPGKHHLGASIHTLDVRTGDYLNIKVHSINVDRHGCRFELDDEYTSITDRCIDKVSRHVTDLILDYDVCFLAYESPFYNPSRPAAYGSLCEIVSCIRLAAIRARSNILIDCMSPQNIKKGMGAGGTKGKEIMFEKVLGTSELMDVLEDDRDSLTEHCIDSIAIGYNARNTILSPMEGWSHGKHSRSK